MNVGSLFSGIGGIELGFERQGFKTKWFVECEPYAQAVLKKRFPGTPIYGDIKKIDFRTVPKVDIITGGFPCQDISNAGKRAGITGSRSSLWKYYFKAIREVRPKIAFIENVSALLNRGLDVVLADIASIGYDAEWHCVPASAIGTPHQRDRIYIIAYSNLHRCNIGCEKQKERREREAQHSFSKKIVTDINFDGCKGSSKKEIQRGKGFSWFWSNRRIEDIRERSDLPKPLIRGVVDGVSNRMDRVKCLGNAVVPQVAEVFAKAIKEKIINNI